VKPIRLGLASLALAAAAGACRGSGGPVGSVSFEPARVRLGYPQSVAASLQWRPARELDRRHGTPVVFVHLLHQTAEGSKVLRTFDHALPKPWVAGQPQGYEIDLYQSSLSEPLAPGRYVLSLGLYDDSWGYRWLLETSDPAVARREYRVAEVEVLGPDPSAPRFSFSDGWKPAEALPTKQVLAHRCFERPAELRVEEIRAGGSLRLRWSVAGSPGASVKLETTCEAGRREILGPGQAWMNVRVPADLAGGRCEIRLEPGAATAGCLEVLAWRPDAPASAGARP
jgi:hypothetical protein